MDIKELIQKRFNEIQAFFNLLERCDLSYEFNRMLLISRFPFRDTDIQDEVAELELAFQREFHSLDDLMKFFHNTPNYDYTKYEYFVTNCFVNYVSLATDWRFGNNPHKLDLSIEDTKKEFLRLYDEPQSEYRKQIVGRMAEYLVREEYKNVQNKNLIWVSELYGDGFGYDFISREGDKCDFLEVKGATKNRPEVVLSVNEAKVFKAMEENNNPLEKYHVIVVNFMYIKDDVINYDIIDVFYQNNVITHVSQTNRFYYDVMPPLESDKYRKITLL